MENDETKHLATLPVTVKRNAYGRQLGSFVTTSEFGEITDYPMVFIRAPYITQISESACENDLGEVKVLAKVDSKIVGVKYKNQIALAFHPEMTDDLRIHKEFLSMIA